MHRALTIVGTIHVTSVGEVRGAARRIMREATPPGAQTLIDLEVARRGTASSAGARYRTSRAGCTKGAVATSSWPPAGRSCSHVGDGQCEH